MALGVLACAIVASSRMADHDTSSPRTTLIIATFVYFVIHTFVPFGQTLLYPLTLLCTWVSTRWDTA